MFFFVKSWNCSLKIDKPGNNVTEVFSEPQGMWFLYHFPKHLHLNLNSGHVSSYVDFVYMYIVTEPCKGWVWEQFHFICSTSWWNRGEVWWRRCSWRCEKGTSWTRNSSNEKARAFLSRKSFTGNYCVFLFIFSL